MRCSSCEIIRVGMGIFTTALRKNEFEMSKMEAVRFTVLQVLQRAELNV